jgi:hypothetical protein
MYRWRDEYIQTLPFIPQQLVATVEINVGDTQLFLYQPVQYRFADPVRGEIRREVELVPAISIGVDQKLIIVPYSEKEQKRRIVMTVTKHSEKPLEAAWASLNFGLFGDWTSVPSQKILNLKNKGEKESIAFEFTIPARTKTGTYFINPHVAFREGVASIEMHTIAYPHIQTRRFYSRVQTKLQILDLKIESVKVGYITGSGDEVSEAIRQMGLNVEPLGEADLASGDLAPFDAIVVGIRAAQVRADFVANHARLLDYVAGGGTLIVQYQPPSYQNLLPFPAQIGARVVDENAPVTMLQPAHSIFNFPNKITDEDFKGWIQERNLNAFTTFDAKYTPLLEAHDAGETENRGGLVVAEIGKGKYIYASYAFFRQLPAGVPGAYRLFANLLSLPKAKK